MSVNGYLIFNMGSTYTATVAANLRVNGNLTLTQAGVIDGPGQIQLYGDFYSSDTDVDGTGVIAFVNTAVDQNIFVQALGAQMPGISIDKPGKSLIINGGDIGIRGNVLGTGGTVVNTGGSLVFKGLYMNVNTDAGLGNVIVDIPTGRTLTFLDHATVNNLTILEGGTMNGPGWIVIAANLTTSDADLLGNVVCTLTGGGVHHLSGTGRVRSLDISNGSGTVFLDTNFNVAEDLTGTGGVVDISSGNYLVLVDNNNMTVGTQAILGNVKIDKPLNGTVTIDENVTVAGHMLITQVEYVNSDPVGVLGKFLLSGGLTATDTRVDGDGIFSFVASQTINGLGEGEITTMDISMASSGVLTVASTIKLSGTLTGSGGTVVNAAGTAVELVRNAKTVNVDCDVVMDNLTITMGSADGLTLLTDLNVAGNLVINEVAYVRGPGAIRVAGDVTTNDTNVGMLTEGAVALVGTGVNNLFAAVNGELPTLRIDKTGGSIFIANSAR